MNWKAFGTSYDLINILSQNLSGEKPSRTCQGSWFLPEIQTEHLLNASLEHYPYTNLLSVSALM
jgi:hypothetical protein